MPSKVLAVLAVVCLIQTRPAGAARRPLPSTQATAPRAGEVLAIPREPGALRVLPDHRLVGSASITSVLTRFGITRGERLSGSPEGAGALRLTTDRGLDVFAVAAALRATGAFRAVCPNYPMHLFETLPDDVYLPYQWHIDSGDSADIDLPAAWDVEKGSSSIVIGIMDTGVDIAHPDLSSRIWTNTGEIEGNGIDDDGDGYIDDVRGWDFGNHDNDPSPHPVMDPSGLDIGFHGTSVAGTAAAATNNGIGIAGADWNARILPLKVVDDSSEITLDAVTEAFGYATDHHIDILNMSLGSHFAPGVPEFFQALVDDATNAGVLCVAAAGNDGADSISYPAACQHVLSVGATDEYNDRAYFSNFGPWVDVAAPGSSIWTSICQNYTFDDLSQIYYWLFFGWDFENPYMYVDGTSFACPLTAGVCALVKAHYPGFSPDQIAQRIIQTGDARPAGDSIGTKVNAFRAVTDPVLSVPGGALSMFRLDGGAPNPFASRTRIAFATAREGPARLAVYDLAGRMVRELTSGRLNAGPHAIDWDGTGREGARLDSGIYLVRLESGGATMTRKLALLR